MNNDLIEKLIVNIKSADKMLANKDLDPKPYKKIISGYAKNFINGIKSNTSYSPIYIKKIITSIRNRIRNSISQDHISLGYIRLSKEEYKDINTQSMKRVKELNLNKKEVNLKEIDRLTLALLKSNCEEHLAYGIALASGRRITEVFISHIEDIKNSNEVMFTGQLKTRDIERFYQGYQIPLTINKEIFFEAYNRFTQSALIRDIKNKWESGIFNPDYVYSRLQLEFYKIFKGKFKISDLRAIYTTNILFKEGYFNDRKGAMEIYPRISKILGHKTDEHDAIGASFNYRDFSITNNNVIENLKEKIDYIKQFKKIEINKKMFSFLNKQVKEGKLIDISYDYDNTKVKINAKTFITFSNAMKDALHFFESEDANLLNKNSLNSTFRRILEQEYKFDIKNNGRKSIRFLDTFLRIEKRQKIKLKPLPRRKKHESYIIKNLIIPREIKSLLKELEKPNQKEKYKILRENCHMLQIILEKLLIDKEKQMDILNYDFLKKEFQKYSTKPLSIPRFKAITQVILNNIAKLRDATFVKKEDPLLFKEELLADVGFTITHKGTNKKYYREFIIETIIIPELHKMLKNKLKISKHTAYSAIFDDCLYSILIKKENIGNILQYRRLEKIFNQHIKNPKNKFSQEKFEKIKSLIKDNLKEIKNKIIFKQEYLSIYEMYEARTNYKGEEKDMHL
ncbi:hypothetical protein F0310_05495 (plasmid) [Borrelia sp. A-FGy1]|uniref:protelomerase family protein n=1 Tax=Borrelia sp. A-FGy1 TaxID=2608247 RepID=UPI0015F691C8|nr:protelomerase family protein [Borrelia sp. A-FGy1]QMU99864.1 hypothetical protein F0310_05495 [Borrelia sp. A-FGy1]